MSITARTGLPGSGKSYLTVKDVLLPAVKQGRTIVTNLPIHREKFPQIADIRPLDLEAIRQNTNPIEHQCPPGALVIIDEVQKIWPAGLKISDVRPGDADFLTEHRHRVDAKGRSTEIVLVTQDLAFLNTLVRSLVETTYITTKLNALGATKSFRVTIYNGPIKGQVGPESKIVTTRVSRYKKDVFELYRSHTQSQLGIAGDESTADNHAVIWKSPVFILSAIFILVAMPLTGIKVYRAFHPKQYRSDSIAKLPATYKGMKTISPHEVTTPELPVIKPKGTQPSTKWRLGGIVVKEDGTGDAAIIDPYGTLRIISATLCKLIPHSTEYECIVDGESVTSWTGSAGQVYGQSQLPVIRPHN